MRDIVTEGELTELLLHLFSCEYSADTPLNPFLDVPYTENPLASLKTVHSSPACLVVVN